MKTISALVILSFALMATASWGQVSFDPAVSYVVGQRPSGVAVADFDNRLRPDIAVTSDTPDKVSILFNQGTGAFAAPTVITLGGGTSPHGIVAGDFDGDLDVDLAVVLKNTDSVQLLVNAAGVFTPGGVTSVNGMLPREAAVGDLDNNGLPDVVTANRDSENISVLLNNAGALTAGVAYTAGADPRGLALGHFNNDTFLDVAVAAHDDRQVSVLLNNGDGTFAAPIALSLGPDLRPSGVTVADVDGDGRTDIVASSSGDTLNRATLFRRTGSGTFAAPQSYAVDGVNPEGVVAVDLDVDGRVDIATSDQDSSQISVLRNLGGLSFATAVGLAVGTTPGPLVAADLDGNGAAELVTANRDSQNVSVLVNRRSAVIFTDGFESGDTNAWSSVLP